MLLRMVGFCKPKPETVRAYWEKHYETERLKAGGFKTNLHRWDRPWPSKLFSSLPPEMRPRAHEELARLMAKCKREGREITRWKYASLCANAAFIVKYDARSPKFAPRHFQRSSFYKRHRDQERLATQAPTRERKYTQGPRVAQNSLDGV